MRSLLRLPLHYQILIALVLGTASSNGTLPMTMTCVEERAGVSNEVSSFVLPLGTTVNMDGTALYEAVALLFISQAYAFADPNFTLTFTQLALVAVTALLASVGRPASRTRAW